MRSFKYIIVGFIFGFGMWKLEAISTFRIFEMFHFQSFHMYGIIFTGVATGFIITQLFRRGKIKTIKGIAFLLKNKNSFLLDTRLMLELAQFLTDYQKIIEILNRSIQKFDFFSVL